MPDFSGAFGTILILFLFVLAVLWFLIPFAVFGIKDKLNQMIKLQKKANDKLAMIVARSSGPPDDQEL